MQQAHHSWADKGISNDSRVSSGRNFPDIYETSGKKQVQSKKEWQIVGEEQFNWSTEHEKAGG